MLSGLGDGGLRYSGIQIRLAPLGTDLTVIPHSRGGSNGSLHLLLQVRHNGVTTTKYVSIHAHHANGPQSHYLQHFRDIENLTDSDDAIWCISAILCGFDGNKVVCVRPSYLGIYLTNAHAFAGFHQIEQDWM